MKPIQLVILFLSLLEITGYYSLYNSDDRERLNSVFDCLYAYMVQSSLVNDEYYQIHYHLIPYCQRLDQTEKYEESFIVSNENIQSQMKFSELYERGVTSLQLLDWLAPIDIAERYERNGQNSDEIFYNCSYPWFGSTCEYKLIDNISSSFGKTVEFIIGNRNTAPLNVNFTIGTCYPFLNSCYRGPSPMCLDWREVCDGNFDCIHGEDEELCSIMKINECFDEEFRCHYSAECIPWSFVRDGIHSIDCLDGTDEMYGFLSFTGNKYDCPELATFECEESANSRPRHFACGDGQLQGESPPNFQIYCSNLREQQMTLAIFTSLDYISEVKCQEALLCLIGINPMDNILSIIDKDLCESFIDSTETLGDHCMSEWISFPEYPILYRFFQFIYFTNRSIEEFKMNILPDLICFNRSLCPGLLFCSIDIQIHNELNCCQIDHFNLFKTNEWAQVFPMFEDILDRCALIGNDKNCSEPSLFYCQNSSKCIPKHLLLDRHMDCYFNEDEKVSACDLNDTKRFTSKLYPDECYSIVAIDPYGTSGFNLIYENPIYKPDALKKRFPFQKICDSLYDVKPFDYSDDTDETNCTWWPCSNSYVRCDNFWNCLNGLDELNCSHNSCSANEHVCVQYESEEKLCFPITHLMEDYTIFQIERYRKIYLTNKTINNIENYLFWNQTKCITLGHLFHGHSISSLSDEDVCLMPDNEKYGTDINYFLEIDQWSCDFFFRWAREKPKFFLTSRLSNFPSILPTNVSVQTISALSQSEKFDLLKNTEKYWYCNRGILILFQTNNSYKCLCPPSYFGDRCQWQNQRISLTIQLIYRNSTYIISVFQLIITLIDEQGQIGPYHEQLTYVPKRDCGTKFNIYLLYPDKPKNSSINYSIRIDLFNKMTLTYLGSWNFSIPFPFLPVNRISTQLFIPNTKQFESSCSLDCGNHGKCVRYINKNEFYFCRCDQGYSGLKCNIKENCSCSLDSYCLTSTICICALNKFGQKCYLNNSICQLGNNPCENNGQCIPIDDRIGLKKFTCLCKEDFNGERCENKIKNIIDIEFDGNLIKSDSAVIVHLITRFENDNPQHTTLLKKIKYGQKRIEIYVTISFHIVFIEPVNEKQFYLVIIREEFIQSEYIHTKLLSNQQCLFIDNLLNITLKSYSYYHRIKYYPLLCRQNKQLMCFYDEYYMCLCDLDRFSNCFTFNHNITYNCQGQHQCENGGKCVQDNATCPVVSFCVCQDDCSYGTKCQFSTNGFILSLDYILSYHIKPEISFSQQPLIIKISTVIVIIMFVFGLINGILSILTFSTQKTRDVGSGLYLLFCSWISILIVIVLLMKYCQLILFQMLIFKNSRLFKINCILLDMILKVLIAANDWLDGCVSIERIIIIIKGISFNKVRSRKLAKWIILTVIIVTILTHLHDPFNLFGTGFFFNRPNNETRY
ncbi:unnamed protein product [Adineta ricciae]|uniref:EGF-like domain-containing protein n=1 Tax=Adineta ricciae TaxID=249248 RepID=A0A815THZ9_ADIRI|nr:unnamed protein product [Adineta ricciae]CAF1606274.1 unnamed protein product [Adineta ricciae]